jgi:hypothetical protein
MVKQYLYNIVLLFLFYEVGIHALTSIVADTV